MEVDEDCEHIHVIEGICNECGLIFQDDFDFGIEYGPTLIQKELILEGLDIPEDVKERAKKNIEIEEARGNKVRNDAKNTFNQVYRAYYQCGILNLDPFVLGEKLGLERKKVTACLGKMSGASLVENNNCEIADIIIVHPVVYVKDVCLLNKLEDYVNKVEDKVKEIIIKNENYLSYKPKIIACAVAKIFSKRLGNNVKSFKLLPKITETSIKNILEGLEKLF